MTYACWKCRNEEPPAGEGAQVLGLCRDHLLERINAIMARRGEPGDRGGAVKRALVRMVGDPHEFIQGVGYLVLTAALVIVLYLWRW